MRFLSLAMTWVSEAIFGIYFTLICPYSNSKFVGVKSCFSTDRFSKAKNEKFMTSALEHIEQTLICAEIIRLLPKTFRP